MKRLTKTGHLITADASLRKVHCGSYARLGDGAKMRKPASDCDERERTDYAAATDGWFSRQNGRKLLLSFPVALRLDRDSDFPLKSLAPSQVWFRIKVRFVLQVDMFTVLVSADFGVGVVVSQRMVFDAKGILNYAEMRYFSGNVLHLKARHAPCTKFFIQQQPLRWAVLFPIHRHVGQFDGIHCYGSAIKIVRPKAPEEPLGGIKVRVGRSAVCRIPSGKSAI